jgi:hypothetical protein
MKNYTSIYAFLFTKLMANATVASENATGSGGSSSYTVGQVFYTNAVGSNGSINQGATTG